MSTLKNRIAEILSDCSSTYKLGHRKHLNTVVLKKIMDEIDKEHRILRPALRWFVGEMEEDLRKNDFKGGWLDGELKYYWGKAVKHLLELRPVDSVRIGRKKYSIECCVKSANYSMMLAHNLIEELKKEED